MDQALVKSRMKGRVVEHHEPRGGEPRMKGVWQGPDPMRLVVWVGVWIICSPRKCAGGESGGLQSISDTRPQITCTGSLEATCLTLPKGPGEPDPEPGIKI